MAEDAFEHGGRKRCGCIFLYDALVAIVYATQMATHKLCMERTDSFRHQKIGADGVEVLGTDGGQVEGAGYGLAAQGIAQVHGDLSGNFFLRLKR